ncbi:TetR/AcrR family transcriptional regulator [Rhodococcus sp. NPDC058514]|uniref:TetR/AcrR family transcriptional regulator n=1 Tax=unclassified Rhodococcus (in: high G+C Gram-positive bacteria) TaxID=192944 RepID=UPI0036484B55
MVDTAQTSDQRLIKGALARASIARHAADVASVEGLTGLTIGRLATDLGLSKSGVATLFGTKENLQVAAVQAAREVFIEHVVQPSLKVPRGLPRLRKLIDRWFDFVSAPVFPGGCFRGATVSEFDSRPGPVRDAIAADQRDWRDLLTRELRRAQEQGAAQGRDAAALAFEIDALLSSVNTALRMGESEAVPMARAIIDGLLG